MDKGERIRARVLAVVMVLVRATGLIFMFRDRGSEEFRFQ